MIESLELGHAPEEVAYFYKDFIEEQKVQDQLGNFARQLKGEPKIDVHIVFENG